MRARVGLSALVLAVGLALGLAALAACGSKKSGAIARLSKADGPVEREAAAAPGAWADARVGTSYFLGDAARTADKPAVLEIVGGTAAIQMQGNTILRFGGGARGAANRTISVEAGAVDLSGTGSFSLDIGDVRLSRNGTIRITAQGGGKSAVELTVGEAQITSLAGGTIDLVLGKPIEIGLDVAVTPLPAAGDDAGVPDADALDAGVPDAAVVDPASGVTAEITGKRAEVQLPGQTAWTPVPAGAAQLAPGTKLRLGAGSSARLVGRGTSLDLAGGSRVTISESLEFALEAGSGSASSDLTGSLALPGGALALKASGTTPATATFDLGKDTKVAMVRGTGKLTGAGGSALDLNRGESALLQKSGVIRVLEAIPGYFDFAVDVGDTLTIHDPRGTTAVKFQFGGKCTQGGIVELDHDTRFRTAKVSSGKESANLLVGGGSWAYRLRCTSGGDEGAAVASGRIAVQRDAGSRALPKAPPSNPIFADGRTWRISYQSQIPSLVVSMKGTGSSFRLTLAQAGKAETFESTKPSVTIPGAKLKEGTYTFWFVKDGVRQDKVSTLVIDFDQTAPQVYIEAPANGKPWPAGDIEVRGAVLPGWAAAVETVTIPIDKQRRFRASVQPPGGAQALAIRLSHPQRGVHYYLRRPK